MGNWPEARAFAQQAVDVTEGSENSIPLQILVRGVPTHPDFGATCEPP
eukprot:COSAG01_NODE_17499_length_1146_cov_0.813754_2_plen_48_part_00